ADPPTVREVEAPVERATGQPPLRLGMNQQLLPVLPDCEVQRVERVDGARVEQIAQRGQRGGDPRVMDQAVLHGDGTPAARAVEAERRRYGLGPGDDMEFAAEAIAPRVIDGMHSRRR